jgi:Uma2 family endonuclease
LLWFGGQINQIEVSSMAYKRVAPSTVQEIVPVPVSPPSERVWPPEQGEWTYEDWLRLPNDGRRYEVLNGELYITPPPRIGHQIAVTKLSVRMHNWVEQEGLGVVLISPVGVRLSNQPVPVQPDVVFVRAARREIIGEDYVEGVPDLVVEVLSPSNWLYDRREKMQTYEQAGVPEYWIVDYRARTVEVRVLEAKTYTLLDEFGSGDVARSTVVSGFEISVDDLFEM